VDTSWVDCDRATVTRRYDRLAKFIPLFDRLLFLPPGLRRSAVGHLSLRVGARVLEIGCGTGIALAYLSDAVGPGGRVYGVDLSPGMLRRARARCASEHRRNVALYECDAADFVAPEPLDGVLFCLSYNTMPHHRAVLRRAWKALRPGGRLVVMDARLPSGRSAQWLLPLSLWLMKHTMLGNPLIQPWRELDALCDDFEMQKYLFGSYYICRAVKPSAAPVAAAESSHSGAAIDPPYRIAAE
jgi:demethylmenaquinone methyltransferase/2-methoxy-6-polyprenyl-1,4-benzoquinol methylase